MAETSAIEVVEACRMRLAGATTAEIASALERGDTWVLRWTAGFEPPPTPKPVVKRIYRTVRKERRPMWHPTDPTLMLRLRNLARRGFDVPPSKQGQWTKLTRMGVRADDRKRLLDLE